MRRIALVVTARPSWCRAKSLAVALRSRPECELFVIGAASALLARYGEVRTDIERDGFSLAAEYWSVVEGERGVTSALSTGLLTIQLAQAFQQLQADTVITIADRHETLATAIAASYQHCRLVHLQGGEHTGSIDEKVRFAVSQLADLHFVANDRAAQTLEDRGIPAQTIHTVGCPSIDEAVAALREEAPICELAGVGADVDPRRPFLLIVQHPVTNEAADAHRQMWMTLSAAECIGRPLVVFWPGEDAGSNGIAKAIREFREVHPSVPVHCVRQIPARQFLRLLSQTEVLVGNSSVGIREASFFGVPVVNVGTRQQGRLRASNVLDVGHVQEDIAMAIRSQQAQGHYPQSYLYGLGHAGQQIAEVLLR